MKEGELVFAESDRFIIIYDSKEIDITKTVGKGNILNHYPMISAVTVNLPGEQVNELLGLKGIKSITKEQVVKVDGQVSNWGILNTKVDTAHEQNRFGKGIKVAIIDTGVDYTHEDLHIVDGVCFAVSVTGDDACHHNYMDDNGHGTHVAGIIGAKNNSIGVIGVTPNVELYAIKVLDSEGTGVTSAVLDGIEWAINQNVDIINLSLTTPTHDPALEAMVNYAYMNGILIVASAGNEGTPKGEGDTTEYPGRYDSVISVAATDWENDRISLSATGPSIEVSAPGEQILSTYPLSLDVQDGKQDGYTYMSGTSMAAPYVSGILAIYKELYPSLSHTELRHMLVSNAIDLGPVGKDHYYGYGLVQATTENSEIPSLLVDVMTEKGTALFTISTVDGKIEEVDVYRNHKLVKEGLTENVWVDYVLKGSYQYKFVTRIDGEIYTRELDVSVSSPEFADLSVNDWYADEIVFLNKYGIINGYAGNLIKPSQRVTRGEALAIVGRAIGLNGEKRETHFTDVGKEYFASGYIQSAFENGVIQGFPDKTFRPSQFVTRAEMAILIANAYQLQPAPSASFSDVTTNVTGYEAINQLAYENITKGYPDGTFKPFEQITRANFSVFVARAENDYFK